jgi:hypothetical protein
MTRARHELIDLTTTSYYHVINRCVAVVSNVATTHTI